MTIRAAIYARSSPGCPMSADEQIEQLRTIACAHGWVVTHVFADRPMTVRKGLDRRPGEAALIQAIRSHSIDKVLILSICRIARSLVDLVGFMVDFAISRPLVRPGMPRIRFLFVRSRFCSALPSDTDSR